MEEPLFDINTVCHMLGTTSRTLRFYEEKGIITSTKINGTIRRKYTQEQVDLIRNVLVLRTLGLSIKDIAELQKESMDLKSAVVSRRAQIFALIDKKNREISLLNEAFAVIESGGNVYQENWLDHISEDNSELMEAARICAEAFVSGDDETFFQYFGQKMREYIPPEVYQKVRVDTLEPLGDYVGFDAAFADKKYPNIVYQKIRYQKLGLKIKFVFHNGKLYGLWFDYYQ